MDNFWNDARERQFLEEIVIARKLLGAYSGVVNWTGCWRILLHQLIRKNPEFVHLNVGDLKEKSFMLSSSSNIGFRKGTRPAGEKDRLL